MQGRKKQKQMTLNRFVQSICFFQYKNSIDLCEKTSTTVRQIISSDSAEKLQ